jgi:hypothetical protein
MCFKRHSWLQNQQRFIHFWWVFVKWFNVPFVSIINFYFMFLTTEERLVKDPTYLFEIEEKLGEG